MARQNLSTAVVLTLVLAVSAQAAPSRQQSIESASTFERIVQKITKVSKRAIQSVITVPKG
jgi:hypothetical protein